MKISIDKVIPKVVSLVTTYGTFALAGVSTGQTGAPRTTSALSTLSIGNTGMHGGLVTLFIESLTVDKIVEISIDKIFIMSIKSMIKNGEEISVIYERIDQFPISDGLKSQLREILILSEKESPAWT